MLEYAAAMTKTPVQVSDALFASLRAHLDEGQLVELTAEIAWENYRARFNHAFGVEAQGFSEGAFCALPERGAGHGAAKAQLTAQAEMPSVEEDAHAEP